MEGLFQTYFKLGYQHILDINGYDHIVFVVALCAIYTLTEWKRVALLVTAFTIGHSLTLALAIFDLIRFSSDVVEKLIPITIMATCLFNIIDFSKEETRSKQKIQFNYILALVFGFIHGMGFSNFLRSTLMPGEKTIGQQLLAFNIGLELGQLIIVAIVLAISYFVLNVLKAAQREWNLFVSGIAFGVALVLLIA